MSVSPAYFVGFLQRLLEHTAFVEERDDSCERYTYGRKIKSNAVVFSTVVVVVLIFFVCSFAYNQFGLHEIREERSQHAERKNLKIKRKRHFAPSIHAHPQIHSASIMLDALHLIASHPFAVCIVCNCMHHFFVALSQACIRRHTTL